MVESVFVRAQWPEAVDSKAQAAAPRVSCPPEGRSRLGRYDQRIVRQDIGLIGGIRFVEQFGRDHGDDVGALPGGFELVGDVHRERHFGTGRDEHGLASPAGFAQRSEEHTSELQSLMRISYAVFCLKKKNYNHHTKENQTSAIPYLNILIYFSLYITL